MNWHSFFFLLFSAIACLFALAVVVSNNVVRMAFYLIVSLGSTSGLFFLAGADFVGAMQLLIYVGGTVVLLVFGVMLTAQGPFVSMKTRAGEWILAVIVGGSLLAVLLQTAFQVEDWFGPVAANSAEANFAEPTATPIGMSLLGARVDEVGQRPAGENLPAGYLLPFEIVSVHLLIVLLGAAYLARPKRRRRRAALTTLEPNSPA